MKLFFALLQGHCDRIHCILIEKKTVIPAENIEWIFEVFKSIELSNQQVSDLDKGLYYLFEHSPTLKKNLKDQQLVILVKLGLQQTLEHISSNNKYDKVLWSYILENVKNFENLDFLLSNTSIIIQMKPLKTNLRKLWVENLKDLEVIS